MNLYCYINCFHICSLIVVHCPCFVRKGQIYKFDKNTVHFLKEKEKKKGSYLIISAALSDFLLIPKIHLQYNADYGGELDSQLLA